MQFWNRNAPGKRLPGHFAACGGRSLVVRDDKRLQIGVADVESTGEGSNAEDGVQRACGRTGQGNADRIHVDQNAIHGLQRQRDARGELQIEEREAANQSAVHDGDPRQHGRRSGGVDDEAFEIDLRAAGGKSESARVNDLAFCGVGVKGAARDGESDDALHQSGRADFSRGDAQAAESVEQAFAEGDGGFSRLRDDGRLRESAGTEQRKGESQAADASKCFNGHVKIL